MFGLLFRIILVAAIIYFLVLPLILRSHSAAVQFYWWMRP